VGAVGAGDRVTGRDGGSAGGERRAGPAGSRPAGEGEKVPGGGARDGTVAPGRVARGSASGRPFAASGATGGTGGTLASGRGDGWKIVSSSRRVVGPAGPEPGGANSPCLSCKRKTARTAPSSNTMSAIGIAWRDDLAFAIRTCVAILSLASGRLPESVLAVGSGPALGVRPDPAQEEIKLGPRRPKRSLNPTTPSADLSAQLP
jgi:hypothetical protein